ncbi:MAG: hypothetical protein PUE60_00180 [Eubacteriales bacterium]|nr:hypothetical protein [Eubacteriales bacterium]
MPYDFKKLSDVTENVTVPEDGKVLYEKDGEIHRAPIKQGEEKKVKYITSLFFCNSEGNIEGYYNYNSSNSNTSGMPTYLDGSDIPYCITSSDINEGKYAKISGAKLCQLYEDGVEIKIGNAAVFANSNDIPSCLEEFKAKPLEMYISANNLAETNLVVGDSGFESGKTNHKSYLGTSIVCPCLAVSDSQYAIIDGGGDVQMILFQAEE